MTQDDNGYGHVAYSHASALLADAMREMRSEYQREIDNLRRRIEDLEAILMGVQGDGDGRGQDHNML